MKHGIVSNKQETIRTMRKKKNFQKALLIKKIRILCQIFGVRISQFHSTYLNKFEKREPAPFFGRNSHKIFIGGGGG